MGDYMKCVRCKHFEYAFPTYGVEWGRCLSPSMPIPDIRKEGHVAGEGFFGCYYWEAKG